MGASKRFISGVAAIAAGLGLLVSSAQAATPQPIKNQYIVVLKPQIGLGDPLRLNETVQSLLVQVGGGQVLAQYQHVLKGFTVRKQGIEDVLSRNPVLITAANSVIGYDKGAAIAKRAYKEGRPVIEVALEMTDLNESRLRELLDPAKLTEGGIG